ncbi:TPA: argininosuccinate lyase, partial [Streptococcus pneumoniae]
VGGLGGWLIGAAAGVLAGAAGRIAYCIGYGALNRGCDINGNPYPWDGFISATVR